MILDKSGSMEVVRDAVIEGYNDYLADLREDTADTYFSLTMFDTRFHHVLTAEPLAQVPALNALSYAPGGMTALYDAIGHTVVETDRRLAEEGRADMKVLVVVMTDGLENSSTDHTAASIGELVRSYELRGNWTFVYLGAGHDTIRDAQRTAAAMGYKAANAMRYEASPAAIKSSMASLAAATKVRRRAAGKKSDAFFADAGQSEQDYLDKPPSAPPVPSSPRVTKIKSSSLMDALKKARRR
jgi:uncharacterized protein YegL